MIRLQWWTVELLSTRSQHDSYDYPLTRSRSQAGVAVPADFYVHQPWTPVKGRFLTCDRRCSGRSWPRPEFRLEGPQICFINMPDSGPNF